MIERNEASLHPDGSRNWFIPPYVIPAIAMLLVVAFAILRTR